MAILLSDKTVVSMKDKEEMVLMKKNQLGSSVNPYVCKQH
jgi:hypothetical protein